MVVAIASAKGGVGKTTTAIHVAAYLAELGATLLIDDDRIESAQRYAERALASGIGLPFQVAPAKHRHRHQDQARHLVFDTSARADPADVRALARGSDYLVLPTQPDAMSLEAVLDTARLLEGLEARWGILITFAPSKPETDADDARQALHAAGMPTFHTQIRAAKAFKKAAFDGRLVFEARGDPRARLAWLDYADLGRELLEDSHA